jgi:short-subunit dehydrogenase
MEAPCPSPPFDPARVLIVGAGPGLGAALARRFGREGFAVTLVGRRPEPLTRLAESVRVLGVPAETVTADAADPIEFRTVLQDLATRITPGVVVYNAALVARDGILTSEISHLAAAYAVDTLGAVSCVQVFSPAMRRAGTGTILATGGYPGITAQRSLASLSLGKAALRAAMKLAHEELKADGVHAASVTIGGDIQPGTQLDPDHIADSYWALHTQTRDCWSDETVVRPSVVPVTPGSLCRD